MRKMLMLLAGASLMIAGVACSEDDPVASADSYDDLEGAWMEQCAPAAAGVPDAEEMCRCAFETMKEDVPLEDLQAYNEEFNENSSAQPPANITQAITDCATAQVTGATP